MRLAYDDIILDQGLGPTFKWFVLVSVLLHVGFFVLAVKVMPDFFQKSRPVPEMFTVNLVSLPSAAGNTPKTVSPEPAPAPRIEPAPAPKPEPKPEPKPVPAPKLEIKSEPEPAAPAEPIPAPEPAELVPVGPIAAETIPAPKAPEVKKIETKPAPTVQPKPKIDPTKAIDRALARVQAQVAKKERRSEANLDSKIEQAIAGLADKRKQGSSGALATGPVSELDSRMREYFVVLYNIISANWIMPPESIVGAGSLEAVYIIAIDRSGEIKKGWFEKKSGHQFFDQSVERAVNRANPLPPLPKVFSENQLEVGLRFTPSGIKRK